MPRRRTKVWGEAVCGAHRLYGVIPAKASWCRPKGGQWDNTTETWTFVRGTFGSVSEMLAAYGRAPFYPHRGSGRSKERRQRALDSNPWDPGALDRWFRILNPEEPKRRKYSRMLPGRCLQIRGFCAGTPKEIEVVRQGLKETAETRERPGVLIYEENILL